MDTNPASAYLVRHLDTVLSAAGLGPVLDLACGKGANGLLLAQKGAKVLFWDRDSQNLDLIASTAAHRGLEVLTRQVDLETGQKNILPAHFFAAVLVFRYLHRPLIPEIKRAVLPGGVVIYETFTLRQAEIGKPSNPHFLLRDNELPELFNDWEIIDSYQGRMDNPLRYMAGILARKQDPRAGRA